jgi:predicted protein tyrosine phosphatase
VAVGAMLSLDGIAASLDALMKQKQNLLFVCSRNQWRSPTAERIFRDSSQFNVRSGGTSSSARRKVTERDLEWADVVLVMESRHRDALREMFGRRAREAEILVLGISDEYQFMDPELVEQLRARVEVLLKRGA